MGRIRRRTNTVLCTVHFLIFAGPCLDGTLRDVNLVFTEFIFFSVDMATMNGKDRPSPASSLDVSQTTISDDVKSLGARVVAYHFCQADNNSTCLIPEFVHSLAAQLCQAPQLSIYRQHVLTELNLQVCTRKDRSNEINFRKNYRRRAVVPIRFYVEIPIVFFSLNFL